MRIKPGKFFGGAVLMWCAMLTAGGNAHAAMPSALASGSSHNCALTTAGGVQCWGVGTYGQLGNGINANSSVPVAVSGLASGVVQVVAGAYHSCALLGTGSVKCWGRNDTGQLGDGTLTNNPNPVTVGGVSGAVSLVAGSGHNCAQTATGSVYCWGANTQGQLGDGSATNRTSAVQVIGVSGAAGVMAGGYHSCAWLQTGTAQCWGQNGYGQLGNGTATGSGTRVNVVGLANVAGMVGGVYHSCAYTTGGAALCWGRNDNGQIGNNGGVNLTYLSPTPVSGIGSGTVQMAASPGNSSNCARFADGSARCWGSNASGQLGTGDKVNKFAPAPVTLVSGISTLAVGGTSACAVVAGGAQCWGANSFGQHGAGNTALVNFAQSVVGLSGAAPAQNPNPLSPVTSATPTYTWQAIPGASSYRLRVNGVTTVYTAVAAGCPDGIGLCKVLGASLAPGAYSWQVQGFNAYGDGVWSVLLNFTL